MPGGTTPGRGHNRGYSRHDRCTEARLVRVAALAAGTVGGSAMMTSDDVLKVKFQATKFRAGYDQDEVDRFLDKVVESLRARERGETVAPNGAPLVTARAVREAQIRTVKYREGYEQVAVDALLDRAATTLADYEAR